MDFGSFAVVCNGCGARGPTADGDGCDETSESNRGKRSALRGWNKRQRAPTKEQAKCAVLEYRR